MGSHENDEEAQAFVLHASAQELELAVTALLDPRDLERHRLANQWINAFVSSPKMWTIALYLAFPPEGSPLGRSAEVRFFMLNLLLSKLRSDWIQLETLDAAEILDVLKCQLLQNVRDQVVGPRLCVVICAAAAVTGPSACEQLVKELVGCPGIVPQFDMPVAIELLTSLAEETLHRSRALSWQVGECMRSCYTHILQYLDGSVVPLYNAGLLAKACTCIERWILAGVTLSEIHSDYPALFKALLQGLGSQNEDYFDTSVTTLTELVSAVDLLSNRDVAVCEIISAVLAHRPYFLSFHWIPIGEQGTHTKRCRSLCLLVCAIGYSEPAYLSHGGTQEGQILEWLIDATAGGGGLGLEGATMAVDVWPRLSAVPHRKRGVSLQSPLFAAAVEAISKVAKYPLEEKEQHDDDDDDDATLEENFCRFRNSAEDALAVCFKELGTCLLRIILENLQLAVAWQNAEVYLYITASLSLRVLTAVQSMDYGQAEKEHALIFLESVFKGVAGEPSLIERVSTKWMHARILTTSSMAIKGYALWIASDSITLGKSINYLLTALAVTSAREKASEALNALCQAAASHLAAGSAFSSLMAACEQSISVGCSTGLHENVVVSLVEGLAAIAAALPTGEAESAMRCLTMSSITSINNLAGLQAEKESFRKPLVVALKIITAVINTGKGNNLHPALPILQEIWPALGIAASNWAEDILVASAICNLWNIIASKVGVAMTSIMPKLLYMISDMIKQHFVVPCLDCLSNIIELAASSHSSSDAEVGEHLMSILGQMTSFLEEIEYKSHAGFSSSKEMVETHSNVADVLRSICDFGSTSLHFVPHIFLPSPFFLRLFHCAIDCIQRSNLDAALSAAKFLSEAVSCMLLTDADNSLHCCKELVTYIDNAVTVNGTMLVEIVLNLLARGQVTAALSGTLADILYGLRLRYKDATECAIVVVLNSSFPGIVTDKDKKTFVAAVLKHPPHPRQTFQDLMMDFSRACQALTPADVFGGYT